MEIEVKTKVKRHAEIPDDQYGIRYEFYSERQMVFAKEYSISEDPMKIAKDVKKITNNLKVNLKNI